MGSSCMPSEAALPGKSSQELESPSMRISAGQLCSLLPGLTLAPVRLDATSAALCSPSSEVRALGGAVSLLGKGSLLFLWYT